MSEQFKQTSDCNNFIGPYKRFTDSVRANQLWDDIKCTARQDPCLYGMIEELLVYYILRYGTNCNG